MRTTHAKASPLAGAQLKSRPPSPQEKEGLRQRLAECEQEIRALDGVFSGGFFLLRGRSPNDKIAAYQRKRDIEAEIDDNAKLEIVLGIVAPAADLYVSIKRAEIEGFEMRSMGANSTAVLNRMEEYGLPELVEEVVEAEHVLDMYERAKEFAELMDSAHVSFLQHEIDAGLLKKGRRKQVEKRHKKMLRKRERKLRKRAGRQDSVRNHTRLTAMQATDAGAESEAEVMG